MSTTMTTTTAPALRQVSWREWANARHMGNASRWDGESWMFIFTEGVGTTWERVNVDQGR